VCFNFFLFGNPVFSGKKAKFFCSVLISPVIIVFLFFYDIILEI